MSEKFTCPICGEPTRVYMGNARKDRLCGKHADELKAGKIQLCPDCNTWYNANEPCKCKAKKIPTSEWKKEFDKHVLPNPGIKEQSDELTCIICGAPSNGKPQCKNCYNETKNHMESLDKNSTSRQLRDYYYNLKERIFIIKSLEATKNQCNKLIAIALTENSENEDSSLIDRVYKDVETLIKSKLAPTKNVEIEEDKKEKDELKSKVNTAQDGHNVDSDMEVRIDDTLYKECILHAYGKSIDEIIEKRKKCDWFIPIVNGQGIYIEYWGMKTPKYLEERKEKEELYKKYNLPYISIEQDDPKQDTQTFTSNLIRELRRLAEEYFGFMPKWKK